MMDDNRGADPSRRALLGALIAGALSAATAGGPGRARADAVGGGGNPYDVRTRVPFRIYLPSGGRYRPRRLLVLTPDGGRLAELPHVARFENVARAPAGRLPVVGRAFGGLPAAEFLTPERRLGALYRRGDDLVADLRQAAGPQPPNAYLSGSIWVLTHLNDPGAIEVGLPALSFAPAENRAAGDLTPVGAAYDADGRLLLAPPYDALFGAKLF